MCCSLNPFHLRCQIFPDFHIKFILQRTELFFRPENGPGQFRQFFCGIPFRIGKGLPTDIIIRHQILVGVGHFNIIAKDFIVPDPEILDAGLLSFPLFKLCQPGLSFCLCFL